MNPVYRKTISSGIWTRVADFSSYDDNRDARHTRSIGPPSENRIQLLIVIIYNSLSAGVVVYAIYTFAEGKNSSRLSDSKIRILEL